MVEQKDMEVISSQKYSKIHLRVEQLSQNTHCMLADLLTINAARKITT